MTYLQHMNSRILLSGLVLLGGCGQRSPKDVAYYVSNPTERSSVLAKCHAPANNQVLQGDCENASKAAFQAGLKSTDMPSL
jgi:hypothetical protein